MSPYVQLGPGWRPNYGIGRLQRRRSGRRPLLAAVALIAAVFAAGLLIGRIEGKGAAPAATGPEPAQYYPH